MFFSFFKFYINNKKETIPSLSEYIISLYLKYNINKKENIMTQDEKINLAQSLLDDVKGDGKKYKRVKKNSGLIERTEESKIILNEDNKQLLKD